MENLEKLIEQGIKWEDEFIDTYLSLVKEEENMALFGGNREEAERLLNTLIRESGQHKKSLEELFGSLK